MLPSLRHLRHHPTLLGALVVATLTGGALLSVVRPSTVLLSGWCLGVVVYIALTLRLMVTANVDRIRQRARLLEHGRWTILSVVVLAIFA